MLIGLSGLAGCGKDTAALGLTNIGFRRDAFADRMRKAMLALDPWVDTDVWTHDGVPVVRLAELVELVGWDEAKRNYSEVRRLLQKFGTEAGRDIHGSNCWVNALFDDWCEDENTVITDVRFNNEASAIRNRGGIVVRVIRPNQEIITGSNSGHASEAGVLDELINASLLNVKDVAYLHEAVKELVVRYEEFGGSNVYFA